MDPQYPIPPVQHGESLTTHVQAWTADRAIPPDRIGGLGLCNLVGRATVVQRIAVHSRLARRTVRRGTSDSRLSSRHQGLEASGLSVEEGDGNTGGPS